MTKVHKNIEDKKSSKEEKSKIDDEVQLSAEELQDVDFAEVAAESENYKRMPPKRRRVVKGRVVLVRKGKPSRI